MKRSTVDIALVGAGPIGIEMAAALKQHGFSYRHLEAGAIGATMQWWAPETTFFSSSDRISIAGVPLQNAGQTKATREEYLTYLRTVVLQHRLEIETYTRVTDLVRDGETWNLSLVRGYHGVGGPVEPGAEAYHAAPAEEQLSASRVILAIGDMHLPRRLSVPGEDLPHASHFFFEPHALFGRKVLVVGGKNSAVEAAIRLSRVGADVTLSYRRAELDAKRVKFWLLPEIKSMIRTGLISFLPRTCVREITPSSVVLVPADEHGCVCEGAPVVEQPADVVLLLTGYDQDPFLYRRAGVALSGENHAPQFNPATMETNQPGLYVAGTGAAGSQRSEVREFIETSHVHVGRIVAHLRGEPPPEEREQPEVGQREI